MGFALPTQSMMTRPWSFWFSGAAFRYVSQLSDLNIHRGVSMRFVSHLRLKTCPNSYHTLVLLFLFFSLSVCKLFNLPTKYVSIVCRKPSYLNIVHSRVSES